MPNQHSKNNLTSQLETERDNIIGLIKEGYSVKEIARRIDYPYGTLYRFIRTNNLRPVGAVANNGKFKGQPLPKATVSTWDPDEIRSLYWDKENDLYEIAAMKGCSQVTVLNFMKRHCIERRSKGESTKLSYRKNPERREVDRMNCLMGVSGYNAASRESWIEVECREWLTYHGIEFDQEYQIDNPGHFYDFRVGDTLIEMDGVYWHNKPEQQAKDRAFEAYAEANGYTVIRITDKELNEFGETIFEERLGHLYEKS